MSKSRRFCFCRKGSQVADAILIKLLLGNNGTAFAKWARASEMRRRAPARSTHSSRPTEKKHLFSETEPLAERHANTKLFLFPLFLFCLVFPRTACRGHITPFTFSADLWGRSSCSMTGCYATHNAARAVSRSNTSATANSQARRSHVNECGSKSQS